MQMINCPHCGKELPEGSKFCQFCGSDIRNYSPPGNATSLSEAMTKTTEEKSKITLSSNAKKWIAISLFFVLLGGNVFQLIRNHNQLLENTHQQATIEQLANDNASLNNQINQIQKDNEGLEGDTEQLNNTISGLEKDIKTLQKKLDNAIGERDKYKVNSDYYSEIERWAKTNSRSFKNTANYYTGSNAIIVRTGETVSLDITNKYGGYMWMNRSNANCSVDWGNSWSGNTTTVEVTGVKTGISEIQFYKGTSEKREDTCLFRVLVIVI